LGSALAYFRQDGQLIRRNPLGATQEIIPDKQRCRVLALLL
jgi:hypothetical protein